MPLDGKALRQELVSGQTIPQSFWEQERFRIGCLLPSGGETHCTISMADLNKDGRAEVIVDALVLGTLNEYVKPVVHQRWQIYTEHAGEWRYVTRLAFCDADRETSHDTRAIVATQPMDMLWLNGHAVNFFRYDCYSDNITWNPVSASRDAQAMAPHLRDIPVLLGGKIPDSLSASLLHRSIILSSEGEPFETDGHSSAPHFRGLPPCFNEEKPMECLAVVHDFDHDGADDVVVISGHVFPGIENYRIATLLIRKDSIWQVAANHPICADRINDLKQITAEIRPATWLPVYFNGRPHLPDESSDSCIDHYAHM